MCGTRYGCVYVVSGVQTTVDGVADAAPAAASAAAAARAFKDFSIRALLPEDRVSGYGRAHPVHPACRAPSQRTAAVFARAALSCAAAGHALRASRASAQRA